MPKRNEKDLPDIPQEVRDSLQFSFVENVDQVLEIALRHSDGNKAAHRAKTSGKANAKTGGNARRAAVRSASAKHPAAKQGKRRR